MSSTVFKKTQQREAIMNFLKTRKDHPTAEIIYQNVRKEHPNISLGTVYRNLSMLAERGDILRLTYDGKFDHFDATTEPHSHFYCKTCHAVSDVEADIPSTFLKKAKRNFDGKIEGFSMFFYGVCKECENNQIADSELPVI